MFTNPIDVIAKITARVKNEINTLAKAEKDLADSIQVDNVAISKIETKKVAKKQAANQSHILRTNLQKLFIEEKDA
jgi:ribosome-binding protein aMBF1 (putative translation factor)